jgi:putative PIN family toxin of toxin-antitoxin system
MKIRVVADTNIYVAAALKPGGPTEIWLRVAARPNSSFELFTSEPILDELSQKLFDKFRFSEGAVSNFVDAIRESATKIDPTMRLPTGIVGDPDDVIVLECALEARANLIVSADRDLLSLNPFRGIGISHPRELKNIFRSDLTSST